MDAFLNEQLNNIPPILAYLLITLWYGHKVFATKQECKDYVDNKESLLKKDLKTVSRDVKNITEKYEHNFEKQFDILRLEIKRMGVSGP